MIRIRLTRSILPLIALVSAASADTIILKNGTRLDGSVLREEADAYVFMITVSRGIKDERRILKSEVSRIDKTDPSLKDFEEIKTLVPAPELFPAAAYQERIEAANAYIKKYPQSRRVNDANAIIATLSEELKAIEGGAIKFKGKLITAEERAADAYALDSSVLAAQMRQRAEAGDTAGALRLFYQMNDLQPASQAFKEAMPQARQLLSAYQQEAEQLSSTLEQRLRTREAEMKQMDAEVRVRTQAAQNAADAAIAAQNAALKAKKAIWLTLEPFNKSQLDEMKRVADTQAKQLDKLIATNAPANGDEAYRKALADIHATHEVEKLNEALESARKAGIKGNYLAKLEEAAKAALPAKPKDE